MCEHNSAGKGVWYPLEGKGVRLHPYCRHCGVLKNVSEDRAKRSGYFMNSLAEIKKRLGRQSSRLSDAQIRLISKELEEHMDFSDVYWIPFSNQKQVFLSIAQKYTNLSKTFIEGFL